VVEADKGADERGEGGMDVVLAFVADGEAAEAVAPGDGPLDDLPVAASLCLLPLPRLAVRGAMPRVRHASGQRR
jgi:hypothetical protein